MMKKTRKHLFLKGAATILLVCIISVFAVGTVFLRYVRRIDTSLDIGKLFFSQGLTTKIFCKNDVGADIELEDQRLYTQNRIFTDIKNIPQNVVDAFVAIEDHRFWEHGGFDVRRTCGAILGFITGKESYGGSTITQQLIKNLTGENQVTVKRKLTEILRAANLEKTLSKREILELYLNTVYLSQGCYGIETAAEKYFGKHAEELTIAEGASLAAIIRYPTRYDPIANPENNLERRDLILSRMNALGYLSDDLYLSSSSKGLGLNVTVKKSSENKNSWFTDCLVEQVIADLCREKGMSRAAASKLVYEGGLTIHSTQNIKMQTMLEEYYTDVSNIPKSTSGEQAQSACVILDKSGAVLAVVGGKGKKTTDRAFCCATDLLRSPGSVIKPVSVYAPALDAGLITWASVFDDVPVTFEKRGSDYIMWPKNNPRVYSGLVNVNQAIKTSINTVSVKVLERLGCRRSFDFLRDTVGISTLVESRTEPDGRTVSDIAPAPLALGATSDGVSLLEMTSAYTMFPSGGECAKPHFYTSVYDKDGNLILSRDGEKTRAISEETADIMTRMMQNVLSSGGTASCIKLKNTVEVSGKTGTSNANTDRWFIGFTPDLVCGVWYGFKDARDIGDFSENPAAVIFDGVMTGAEALLTEKQIEFTHSKNVVACLYCKDSGLLPTKVCGLDVRGGRTELGYFLKGTEPSLRCGTHVEVGACECGGISLGACPFREKSVALIKVWRDFPCQVKITDAQYVYRDISSPPSENPSDAFFESERKGGHFFGTSGVPLPLNRACPHYFGPTDEDFENIEDIDGFSE